MICDSSGLLAAFFGDQLDHRLAVDALTTAPLRIVTEPTVTALFQRINTDVAAMEAIAAIRELAGGGYHIEALTPDVIEGAAVLLTLGEGLPIPYETAVAFSVSRRTGIREILTFDPGPFHVLSAASGHRIDLVADRAVALP